MSKEDVATLEQIPQALFLAVSESWDIEAGG